MICKKCGGATAVKNTVKKDDAVYRVRECKECGAPIYTCERETSQVLLVKDMLNERFRTSRYLKGGREDD